MSNSTIQERIYYVDCGRAVASVLSIVLHSANVFSRSWVIHVDPAMYSQTIWVLTYPLSYFRMPLFLFVAGFFTMYGLRKYTVPNYLKHRSRRILLPLVTSVVLLLPVQHYFVLKHLHGAQWRETFFSYLNPISADFTFEHLWFLYYILVYSVLMVVLRWLYQVLPVPSVAKRIVYWVHQNLLLTIVFWIGIQSVAHVSGKGLEIVLNAHEGWLTFGGMGKNLPMYLFGCYCFAYRDQMDSLFQLNRQRVVSILSVFIVLFSIRVYMQLSNSPYEYIGEYGIDTILRWVLVVGVMSLLRRWFNRDNKIQNYFSDASYPVYLFHQPIIIAITYFLIHSSWGYTAWTGYMFVVGCAVVLTYLAHEILVRRNPLGAFLFTGIPFRRPSRPSRAQ